MRDMIDRLLYSTSKAIERGVRRSIANPALHRLHRRNGVAWPLDIREESHRLEEEADLITVRIERDHDIAALAEASAKFAVGRMREIMANEPPLPRAC